MPDASLGGPITLELDELSPRTTRRHGSTRQSVALSGLRLTSALLTRSIMRWTLAQFQCAEIGRLAGEAIGYIGQRYATIDRCRAGLESEVEVLGFVERLNRFQILRIQLWDVDKDVVIHDDAVLILMSRPSV